MSKRVLKKAGNLRLIHWSDGPYTIQHRNKWYNRYKDVYFDNDNYINDELTAIGYYNGMKTELGIEDSSKNQKNEKI